MTPTRLLPLLLASSSAVGQTVPDNVLAANLIRVINIPPLRGYQAFPAEPLIITNASGEVWSNYVAPYSYKGTNYTNVLEGHLIGYRFHPVPVNYIWISNELPPFTATNVPNQDYLETYHEGADTNTIVAKFYYHGNLRKEMHFCLTNGAVEDVPVTNGSVTWRVPPESKERK